MRLGEKERVIKRCSVSVRLSISLSHTHTFPRPPRAHSAGRELNAAGGGGGMRWEAGEGVDEGAGACT